MGHVKHLGFEMELRVLKIVRALAWVPEQDRLAIVESLAPVGLRRAVADQLGMDDESAR